MCVYVCACTVQRRPRRGSSGPWDKLPEQMRSPVSRLFIAFLFSQLFPSLLALGSPKPPFLSCSFTLNNGTPRRPSLASHMHMYVRILPLSQRRERDHGSSRGIKDAGNLSFHLSTILFALFGTPQEWGTLPFAQYYNLRLCARTTKIASRHYHNSVYDVSLTPAYARCPISSSACACQKVAEKVIERETRVFVHEVNVWSNEA